MLVKLAVVASAAACTFRVSPHGGAAQSASTTVETVETVHEAARRIASLDRDFASDVVVCLSPGTHSLNGETLKLDESHNSPSGRAVIWRSEDPERPAVLSGGVQLTKWYHCDDGTHCPWPSWRGVWVAMVSDIVPALPTSDLPVRQLWVNGNRAIRTHFKPAGLTATATGYKSSIPLGWSGDIQIEMLWTSTIKNWIEPRCIVTAANSTNVVLDALCWQALIARNGNLPPPPSFVENVNLPPNPGEFYATSQYIFYRPPGSDSSTTHTEDTPGDAWVGVQGSLVEADGVVNHQWEGVGFKHGTWRQPNLPGGYVPTQTAVTAAGGEPTGAVKVTASKNVSFDRCSFVNIGTAYALSVGNASQGVRVTGNVFEDCSGGAVKLGNVDDTRALATDPVQWDVDMLLSQNTMTDLAVEFRGAAAVFAGYVARTTISQNTIRDTGYTGISLGWGWGNHVKGPQTFASDNHITGNFITAVMSALNDGGCTYTLGPQPRSTVSGNYCQQDHAPVVGCFYHDNGSRYFKTFNNVADKSPAPCVYLQGCCNSPAYNISVSNLWCRSTAPVRNGCAAQDCTIDNKTMYVLDANANWPSAAQQIIDAAGATAAATANFV